METGVIITYIFYLISLGALGINLKTSNKDYFLLSVLLTIFGSITYHLIVISELKYILFLIALLFSFLGDLFMARKIKIVESRIINGTIGFGMAHILYIIVFLQFLDQGVRMWQILIGIFFLIIIYKFAVYTPSLAKVLLVGTLIYALILATLLMTISSFALENKFGIMTSTVALLGVVLFIISDSIIAYTEFKGTLKYSSQIISLTYIVSQILLQSTLILIGV
ncbi:MAG: hypothetical protein GPJ54_09200 [Candidatus Heimdallarchaeota archaeon]|nr:hypothetical protein [Candidatus Heimdallarchaeota archaeon]